MPQKEEKTPSIGEAIKSSIKKAVEDNKEAIQDARKEVQERKAVQPVDKKDEKKKDIKQDIKKEDDKKQQSAKPEQSKPEAKKAPEAAKTDVKVTGNAKPVVSNDHVGPKANAPKAADDLDHKHEVTPPHQS